jgi:NAD(P)-dependent dehydrogenase (short-subunit alcohol dehydrogenase family)
MGICDARVVIVTGGARGLGRSYALAFARAGANVVVNDLGTTLHGEGSDASAAHAVVEEIRSFGGKAVANGDDVADWDGARRLVGTALDAFGDLHTIVNNAGIVRDRMFVSQAIDEWDAVLRVHVRGHFCVAAQAVNYWRVRSKAGHRVDARIINTSSGAGLHGSLSQAAYSAAKGAIASLTLVQAAELGRYGITANALAPAARTRMTEGAFAEKMKRPAAGFDAQDPDNVAPAVVWLGSTHSAHVTGCVFWLEGGRVMLCEGWQDGPSIDKGARWEPEEIGAAVAQLLNQRRAPHPVWGA